MKRQQRERSHLGQMGSWEVARVASPGVLATQPLGSLCVSLQPFWAILFGTFL